MNRIICYSSKIMWLIIFLATSQNLFSQEIKNPQILSYEESLPYIKAVRSFPWALRLAFGWQNEKPTSLKYIFSDSSKIQVFQFPNHRTALCFIDYEYGGGVVFETGTQTILNVYPWSERVKENLENGYDAGFYFENYGYEFERRGIIWVLSLNTLVHVNGEYQVWHFYFDLDGGGLGSGRTMILTEKPFKGEESSDK
jgi:hypothetical protein